MGKMTSLHTCTAFAPATVANVACGFDVLGFALEQPGDMVLARRSDRPGVRIVNITGDAGRLPRTAEQNTAGIAAGALLAHMQQDTGVELELHKGVPPAGGLGSSAASAVAAVVAVNALLGNPLPRRELLPFVLEAEAKVAGAAHADNAAPALLGGWVLVRPGDSPEVIPLPVPSGLRCVIFHPEMEIPTAHAREMLSRTVPLEAAVRQWANLAGLMVGLFRGDMALIGRCLEDGIVEPQRAGLIPEFYRFKAAARDAGALGCSISGAGPCLFALCEGEASAAQVAQAWQHLADSGNISGTVSISRINSQGARVLSAP